MAPAYSPPAVPNVLISFPAPHVLLVTLNRPRQLNALRQEMHPALDRLWRWYDAQPSLRCAVLTGTGRAFCAGADLKEWDEDNKKAAAAAEAGAGGGSGDLMGENGFGGLSNRRGKKPVIAAVNGLCLGGGMEMALNADMVIAGPAVRFGLPEVKSGVVAIAGALPRLIRTVGRQRASEMAMLGRMYTAQQMLGWGVVNRIADGGESAEGGGGGGSDVVGEALRWAGEVAGNSPDSIIVTREGLLGGWDGEDPQASVRRVHDGVYEKLDAGENKMEGVSSFVQKRRPKWTDSKL